MGKIEVKKLDLKNIVGVKDLIKYKKIKNTNKNNLKIKKNYFKGIKKHNALINNNTKKENEKKINEEEENINSNIFNRTFNNKEFIPRKKSKQISFKLNNIIDEIKKEDDNDYENKNEVKKLIRNFSSISKQSTMYKTKKKWFSSKQLNNNINKHIKLEKNNVSIRRKSYAGRAIVRSFSSNNFMNSNNTNNTNNPFGGSQFITALNPIYNQIESAKKMSDNKSNKSYFFNKIKAEKKFLTYFDIKKIYFLDKKVYKPNKEFEDKVNKLKRNNSQKFIMNFNLDTYKMTVLNLFQKHVCHQNFEIMKKNFDLINKAWKWKDNLKCHVRKKKAISTTQTEREMKYNQNKIDRENRIKNKNINNKKENKNENTPL